MVSGIQKWGIAVALVVLTLSSSCKKEDSGDLCTFYTEKSHADHLVDLSVLSGAPEILATLAAYPQLQVYRAEYDQAVGYVMHAHVYYNGVKIINANFAMFKGGPNNIVSQSGTIPDSFAISLKPTIGAESAITIARSKHEFHNVKDGPGTYCLNYQLGIFDVNRDQPYGHVEDNRLVWVVEGHHGSPIVILDAHDGTVYFSTDY